MDSGGFLLPSPSPLPDRTENSQISPFPPDRVPFPPGPRRPCCNHVHSHRALQNSEGVWEGGRWTRTITGAIPMAVPHGPAFQATPLLGLMVLSTSGTALEASLQDDFVSNRAAPMAQHCLMQQRPLTPLGLSQGGISLGSHTTSDKRTWRQLLRDHYRQ